MVLFDVFCPLWMQGAFLCSFFHLLVELETDGILMEEDQRSSAWLKKPLSWESELFFYACLCFGIFSPPYGLASRLSKRKLLAFDSIQWYPMSFFGIQIEWNRPGSHPGSLKSLPLGGRCQHFDSIGQRRACRFGLHLSQVQAATRCDRSGSKM